MSQLTLDMSGKGGLAPRFWGDIDRTSASQNFRILGGEDQMADGIYNPFRRYGYLAPANTTMNELGIGGTMYTTLGASVTWTSLGIAVKPASTTTPTMNGSASSSNDDTSDTTHTLSHTIASSLSNSILIVAVTHMTGSAVPSGVTWNGTAMTLATSTVTNGFVSLWYLIAPASGTHDIVATWAVNTSQKAIHAITLVDAAQSSPTSGTGSGSGTSALASVSVDSTVMNSILIMATASENATHAPGNSQTERTDLVSGVTPYRFSTSTRPMTLSTVLASSAYDIVNDDFYFAERGQNLYKGDTLDDSTLSNVLDLGSTGTPVIMDLEFYQVNGARKLFVVYEKSDYVEIAISSLPYDQTADDDDWLSTAPTNPLLNQPITGDAFLVAADNGFAYLMMDNQIHKIDGTTNGGTNGTISANVLLFPTYFRIVDAIDYRGLMFISIQQNPNTMRGTSESITARNVDVGVYIWDRLSSVVQTRDYIPIKNLKSIRKIYASPSGSVRLIGVTPENTTVLMEYNGSTFKIIEEVGLKATPTYIDSVATAGGYTIWVGNNGIIYAHGGASPYDKEALYKIGSITVDINSTSASSETSLAGAILFGGSNTDSSTTNYKVWKTGVYLSYFTTTHKTFKEWDIHGTGASGITAFPNQGDVYTLVKYLPTMSNVRFIDIYMAPCSTASGSTTAATVKIYFNQSATAWASKTITYDDLARGYKRIEINKPYVTSIQLEVEWASIALTGSIEFNPSVAIVDYEDTNTKSST